MHEPITEDTYLLYCSKHYDGGFLATTDDLHNDLSRIKYIKKLITRYRKNGDLQERLMLNHIIVLNNMFGAYATARILFFKLEDDFEIIKPFLVLLSIMPERFENVGEVGRMVDSDMLAMDQTIVDALRKL